MNNKIGILCAGDSEVAPIIPNNCFTSRKAMLTFYEGTIEGIEVVTLFSGVCKVNAAIATQILIDTYGCNLIINAGTAGGMDKNLNIFDTVISTESAYWDVDEKILTDFHPWMETIYFRADARLIRIIKELVSQEKFIQNVVFGRMMTSESFIQDEKRDEINLKYQPLSIDMETASVAHVCYVNEIPYIAIRTITDTADHSGIDAFELNCEKASQISANIIRALLKELFLKGL